MFSMFSEARLRASKLSHDTSKVVPSQVNMSTIVHEETLAQCSSKVAVNHMTLQDVSAIEKETELQTNITNPDLSVSLLPFMPTVNYKEQGKDHNKSTGSTISDKTFVKKSVTPSSSDEETDEDTVIEENLIVDSKENTRPLLFTADQSIRILDRPARQEQLSLPNKSFVQKPKIKQEKVSLREPIKAGRCYGATFHLLEILSFLDCNAEHNHLGKTFLLNNNTFDADKSGYVRPTITINDDALKLPTIASAES